MARVSIPLLSPADIDEASVLARVCEAALTLTARRARVALRDASPGGVLLAPSFDLGQGRRPGGASNETWSPE